MGNIRGQVKLLSELAFVCTEKQFANLCASNPYFAEKNYVYMSSVQERGKLCGGVTMGLLPSGSVAIIPLKCSAEYLAFLLTSFPCQYMLFDKKLNVKSKVKISRKSLSKLVAFEVNEVSEHAYGVAEKLKEQVYQLYMENMDDLTCQHFYNLIYEGKVYYEGISITPTNLEGIKLKANKEHTVLSVWNRACKFIGFADDAYPEIGIVVKEKNTGVLLKDLPTI